MLDKLNTSRFLFSTEQALTFPEEQCTTTIHFSSSDTVSRK